MVSFGQQVDAVDHTFEGIAEVVDDDDIVVRLQQFECSVTSNVTKTTSD